MYHNYIQNFLSINKIVKAGHVVQFADNKALMKTKQNQEILTADLVNDIFIANLEKIESCEIMWLENGIKGLVI